MSNTMKLKHPQMTWNVNKLTELMLCQKCISYMLSATAVSIQINQLQLSFPILHHILLPCVAAFKYKMRECKAAFKKTHENYT